jgi:hypothetical protein
MNGETKHSGAVDVLAAGDGVSLLLACADACIANGGEWYAPDQMLAILGDHVSNPALLADAAFIGMATPEQVAALIKTLRAAKSLIDRCEDAMKRTVLAFEALGNAGNFVASIEARRECEAAMVAQKSALANVGSAS